MKRFLTSLSLYVSLCALVFTVASPLAQAAKKRDSGSQPRAALSTNCVLTADGGKLTENATMRPVSGTKKLMMQFLLQSDNSDQSAYSTAAVPGLGLWVSPTDPPTLGQHPKDVWHVDQPAALTAGSQTTTYRFEVKFRWYGSGSQVLKNKTIYGSACTVPGTSAS